MQHQTIISSCCFSSFLGVLPQPGTWPMLFPNQVASRWLQDALLPSKPHLKLLEVFPSAAASVRSLPSPLASQQW